jgi:hypothetical protein
LFGNVPGDGGDALAWLVFFLFTWATVWWPMTLYRWRGLARLVRGPYATRHGMVIDVSHSALRTTFGATVATIQLPGETAVRIRLISGQRLSWLSVGQDVDLMEQAPIKARPVVLARPGGQVALGIARHGEPDTAMRLARATEPSESH